MPASVQLPLLSKVLTFERNLRARTGGAIVVGVLSQKRVRPSTEARDDLLEASLALGGRLAELPCRFTRVEIESLADLEAALDREPVHILYITPLRAVSIDEVVAATRRRGITSVTGVPEYVERGVAVGIGLRGDRPQLLVHLEGARAEGADFNSQLLKVARVFP